MTRRKVPKRSRPSRTDYENLAGLRYALRRFAVFSASAARAAGLPAQQHQALLAIKGHPDANKMTIGALAGRLLITPHATTELVDRLADAGFVSRVRDSQDRRRLVLALTQRAQRTLRSLSVIHLKEIRDAAPALLKILKNLDAG